MSSNACGRDSFLASRLGFSEPQRRRRERWYLAPGRDDAARCLAPHRYPKKSGLWLDVRQGGSIIKVWRIALSRLLNARWFWVRLGFPAIKSLSKDITRLDAPANRKHASGLINTSLSLLHGGSQSRPHPSWCGF